MITSKRVKAIATAVVAVAMVASLAAPATAATSAELQAQIDALLAQIASLQAQLGGSVSVSCTFTRNLFLGVSGEDVRCLQRYMNSAGFTVAVARWQAANNVSPAVGYFGPISQAKYRALLAVNPPADDDDDADDDGTCSI